MVAFPCMSYVLSGILPLQKRLWIQEVTFQARTLIKGDML